MDLIRDILILIRDHKHGFALKDIQIDGFTKEQIGFHSYLLNDASLIEALDNTCVGDESPSAKPLNLTWAGYEFIENAYDEEIWNESKQVIGKLGTVSFSVWSTVLAQLVIKNLGI